jgi:ATP-binding cassette subfamily B protein/subfamily B ATP-binding cassette protein MsbA
MRNFLRAVKCSWPYRWQLLLSVICAVFAAILWGLSFTAVAPVLHILETKQTLQDWARLNIKHTQKRIDTLEERRVTPVKESDQLKEEEPNAFRDKRFRDVTRVIAGLESDLRAARMELWFYQVADWHCSRFLPTDPFLTLVCVLVAVVVAVAVKGIFEFGQESLVGRVVNSSLYDLRNRLYRKVVQLDVNNFSEDGTHELMARFTNDMEVLGLGTKTLFGKVVAEPLKAIACVVIACWFSWQLTLMFLILVPAAFLILNKVGRLMKRATRRLLERMSFIYKILQETFLGIRVVKAFTMEPYERRRFRSTTRDYYRKAMWVVNLDAMTSPIMDVLGMAAISLALLAGAYLVLGENHTHLFGLRMTSEPLTHEGLLQLYALLASIVDPVRKLSSVYTRIQSGAAAADRVFALVDRVPRVHPNSTAPRLPRHSADIEFRDVCFSYDPGRPILTNIQLKVAHGETIAVVGRNGCGKTTLVGLLARFFDPDHGSVLVDGHELRSVNLRSLRRQIGLVTQETTLFDDTIYANIAYGNRGAPPQCVEEAARKAYAHDFIMKLPQGYQTRIGEAGSKLSGGQKQRLALARAILRDPQIFILDEFTSQSDVESEALIHKALREFIRNRTTFVITHRLNTLEIANRIVVLEHGRIAAVGAHGELVRSCPEYARLYEAYSKRLSA